MRARDRYMKWFRLASEADLAGDGVERHLIDRCTLHAGSEIIPVLVAALGALIDDDLGARRADLRQFVEIAGRAGIEVDLLRLGSWRDARAGLVSRAWSQRVVRLAW